MDRTLDDVMEYGHVIRVQGGVVHDEVPSNLRTLWAPELYWTGDTANGAGTHDFQPYTDDWCLLDGYSGQFRYAGPIMHDSEYVGGRLERDILARDGYYVRLACDDPDDPENAAGWAVAYRPLMGSLDGVESAEAETVAELSARVAFESKYRALTSGEANHWVETGELPEITRWAMSSDAVPEDVVQVSVYAEAGGERVATVFGSLANAHLVVAAPDLLDVARMILDRGDCVGLLDDLRAAVAKAEGE